MNASDIFSLAIVRKNFALQSNRVRPLLYLALIGFLIGLGASCILSVFRITFGVAYGFFLSWNAPEHRTFLGVCLWFAFCGAAALLTGWLVRNPAIRFGGEAWIREALSQPEPHVIKRILIPKFLGSWLVLACGISVGSEGPSIQMGAATAAGMRKLPIVKRLEQRFCVLAGCAAGLGAAFSAPFSGICYVYEVMRERMCKELLLVMLAASFGVYIGCEQIFGLGTMLPIHGAVMPAIDKIWLLIPLAILSGFVGIAYNYLLHISRAIYAYQEKAPALLQPLFSFGATAIVMLIYPATTGEGLEIFSGDPARITLMFLCFFLFIKLFFTAYCYGSAIPAGVMVPLLCVGGVMGAIYGDWMLMLELMEPGCKPVCIVMGMAGAFAAAKRAPLTAVVLVAEVTGSWPVSLGLLLVSAIGVLMGRLAGTKG